MAMASAGLTSKEAIDRVKQSPATKVKLAIIDIDGVLRGKYVHKDKFLSAVESGFGFCNVVFGWDSADVCYDNARYTGWHTGYPDATRAHRSVDLPRGALGRQGAVLPGRLRGRAAATPLASARASC